MCGLFGEILKIKGLYVNDIDWKLVAKRLKRRGPDYQGHVRSPNYNFYHTRLSFLELGNAANQPVKSPSGRYILLFNGEIYNFRAVARKFNIDHQNSDTLLLASLLDLDLPITSLLSNLDGMFAIAVYDTLENKLFLARDRFGEKPLYYLNSPKKLSFSSDGLILAKINGSNLDNTGALAFVKYGFYPPETNVFQKVNSITPGTVLIFSLDRNTITSELFSHADLNNDTRHEVAELEHDFEKSLLDSVESRLYADTEIGIFLSGGVDSALLASAAAKLGNKIHGFSIDLEGVSSERKNICSLADILGMQVSYVYVDADIYMEQIETLVENFDQPFCDSSAILTSILSKSAKACVKGALSGDGADEILWGYPHIDRLRQIRLYSHWPITSKISKGFLKGEKLYRLSGSNYQEKIDRYYDFSRGILSGGKAAFSTPQYFLNTDMVNYLPMNCLKKIDNASMAYGFEIRAPFLSNDFFEFNKKLTSIKDTSFLRNKGMQRKILKKWNGHDTTFRGKKGFSYNSSKITQLIGAKMSGQYLKQQCEKLKITSSQVSQLKSNNVMYRTFLWRLYCLDKFIGKHQVDV